MDDPFDLPPDVLRRIPLFAEIQKVLSWRGGPVNWDLARQIAISVATGSASPVAVTQSEHDAAAEHVRIAELWLSEMTGLPTPSHLVAPRAATPPDWAEHATTAFRELIDPVAGKVTRAIAEQLPQGEQENPVAQAISQMAPMLMGIQAGTIFGTLAREVTGSHELGLPAEDDRLLLVMPTIDEMAADYAIDRAQVRQWVALHAAAHRMAFEGFPWVRAHFFALFHNFVASLDVDLGDAIRRLQELDLSDPSKLQDVLGDEGLFAPQPSPQTAEAATRVGSFLAVVEAHTDAAVEQAGARAGDVARIGEALRRRAAGPRAGSRMLSSFIGLEHADGSAAQPFVRAVLARGGWALLARMWEDPEAFPSRDELSTPDAWIARIGA